MRNGDKPLSEKNKARKKNIKYVYMEEGSIWNLK